MGRKKIKPEDKAVKESVTIRASSHKRLLHKISNSGKKKSRIISDDLTWYWELMYSTDIAMNQRFSVQEIRAVLSLFAHIKVTVGETNLLRKKLLSLFLFKPIYANALFSNEEIKSIEQTFQISARTIHQKLSKMNDIENIWLYEKLQQVSKQQIISNEDLAHIFRCSG